MIRHVLLDADGVVQSPVPLWRERLESHLGARSDAFLQQLWEDERPCLIGEGDFKAVVDGRLKEVDARITAEILFADFWHAVEPDPAVLTLVSLLQERGYLVHLATNQQRYRLAHLIELGHLDCFDSLQVSCEVGAAKPDPEYFRRVLIRLGALADQVVFVDDTLRNVEAALSTGIASRHWHHRDSDVALPEVLRELGVDL